MLVADSILSALENDGYVVVEHAVPAEVIAAAIEAVELLHAGVSRRRNGGAMYAARNVLDHAPGLRRCAEHESIHQHVRRVLDDGAVVTRAILFDKNPSANWSVPWHQDTSIAVKARPRELIRGFGPWSVKDGVPHVQPPSSVLDSMLTVRVHLDDCGESNAPLRVIPGTHRAGIMDARAIEFARDEHDAVSCVVPAGGLLLMRPLLLHASSAASNPRHRRVIHLEWAAGSLPHGLEWHRA
jgi:ectoine hydroxylase-related dioxygenase (phytanoyl-CoA dioxygenase family)